MVGARVSEDCIDLIDEIRTFKREIINEFNPLRDVFSLKIGNIEAKIEALCERQRITEQDVDKILEWMNSTKGSIKTAVALLVLLIGLISIQIIITIQ